MGRLNPSSEAKFSGTHEDRGIFIFPVQLTTSMIGNLTRLIHTLLYVMTIHIHTYIHTECMCSPTTTVKTSYCAWCPLLRTILKRELNRVL